MKQLKCEMCGSADLVKQDGFFVCQNCGVKYSVEEAKKMMVEGTVDVSGSRIIIDNTDLLQKYYASARASVERRDWQTTEEIYSKIELERPGDMEAVYFKAVSRTRLTYGSANMLQREEMFNQLNNALEYIGNNIDKLEPEEIKPLFERIHISIIDLTVSNFAFNIDETAGLIGGVSGTYHRVLKNVLLYMPGSIEKNADWICSKILEMYETAEQTFEGCNLYEQKKDLHEFWKSKNPNHEIKKNYLMIIKDVFTIEGRGTVITGFIENGIIQVNEAVTINNQSFVVMDFIFKEELAYKLRFVTEGMSVGLVLRGATQENCHVGDVVYKSFENVEMQEPKFEAPKPEAQSSGGCYVATCVYGSYDCPQVWTLRRYRDYTLDETWYGRLFIKAYYAISPTIVKWFGHTEWFKKMWKGKLDRMVAKLQANGVESTPYEDK